MRKRGLSGLAIGIIIFLSVAIVFLLIVLFVLFFSGENYDEIYEQRISSGEIVSPLIDKDTGETLTTEEAVEQFDEDFVYYLLISIRAYNLHTPSFGSDKPEIEFYIGEDVYNSIIDEGDIYVFRGETQEEDIIIRTSKEEAVMMIRDEGYIEESFQTGGSSIEMVAGKTELASKGYLEIYTSLTGGSITGFFVEGF